MAAFKTNIKFCDNQLKANEQIKQNITYWLANYSLNEKLDTKYKNEKTLAERRTKELSLALDEPFEDKKIVNRINKQLEDDYDKTVKTLLHSASLCCTKIIC
ncbi:MAG: hypothetical protein COC15_00485 [Legionellales bacterium]|nr:MAG: hypothetical protein COC15_00485 [Legionellales bacterium]